MVFLKSCKYYILKYSCVFLSSAYIALVFVNELKSNAENELLLVSAVLIATYLLSTTKRKEWVTRLFVNGLLFFSLFHFVVNSISIYEHIQFSDWFYSLRLHRVISLHSLTITQFLLLAGVLLFHSKIDRKMIFVMPVLLYFLVCSLADVHKGLIQIVQNTSVPYNDRLEFKLGGRDYAGWIWPYTQFIQQYTTSNSIIAIPPQSIVWKMEGNTGYLRWFLHPRTLVNSSDPDVIPENVEYILIARGDCMEGACIWPKQPIAEQEIEKLIIIDRKSTKVIVLEDTAYIPGEFDWGLIQLRK